MHTRHAVYYAPPAEGALARLGAAWLGRCAQTGARPEQPAVDGIAAFTATPRRYGLHGTLKPPMRLADGCGPADLLERVRGLARTCAPVDLGRLRVARLGGFLALVCERPPPALADLAARVVADLDALRAAPTAAELARRRAAPLSPRQEALLARWGYPHVMEEFRFHLTLTGALAPAAVAPVTRAAEAHFAEALATPQTLGDLAVFAEDTEGGVFHILTRVPLTG